MISEIKKLNKVDKDSVISKTFLLSKEGNIEIYYAPFEYINPKAKIVIVGITPGLQQMIQSFQAIKDGKSLSEVKDLSSFKGAMRTTLVKFMDELRINKILKIQSCECLFNLNNKYLHSTSLVKYPVFEKGKNYSGVNILKKKILLDFIEDNFLKELEVFQGSIIVPLGNSVSTTIDYLNTKHQLKLKCFLKGFPHPSGLNARKNIQFKENREEMCRLLTRVNF